MISKGFIDHFESYVKDAMDNKMFTKTIGYDTEIELSDINESNFKILSRMSPFGLSNYRPIFRTNNCCGTGNLRLIGNDDFGEPIIYKGKTQYDCV